MRNFFNPGEHRDGAPTPMRRSQPMTPGDVFNSFFDENFFDQFSFAPGGLKVDVRETGEAYILDAEMPGMTRDNITLNIEDNTMTITAHMEDKSEESSSDGHYLRKERRQGVYSRRFSVDDVRIEDITAEMKNGVLTIRCPKKEPTPEVKRRIDIQ